MNPLSSSHESLALKLADLFRRFPNVEAVALAGSQTASAADPISDIDLYVLTTSVIPLPKRVSLVAQLGATRADLNLQFWDLGDEWCDAETGIEVDVIYWDTAWIEDQLDRLLVRHQASLGYTTSFWHTIRSSQSLYDKNGWFHALQDRANAPYPEELRRAIIALNHPVLRRVIPSYRHQIEKAVRRSDLVSLNHRVAALLASYFDILFALNYLPHPGEKHLLKKAAESCAKIPDEMVNQVESVLQAAASADPGILVKIDLLIDGLDQRLHDEGFDLET
jgi:hypothetical protein